MSFLEKVSQMIGQGEVIAALIGVLLILIGMAGVVHYPWHEDELVFFSIGKSLDGNVLPYVDLKDNKLPGIYWLAYLLPQQLFVIRVLMLGVQFVLAYWVTRLLPLKSLWDQVLVGCFLVIVSWHYQGMYLLTESWMSMFLVTGLVSLFTRHYWMSGILVGMAMLFKQIAWPVLLVIFLYLYLTVPKSRIRMFSIGFGLVLGGALGWLWNMQLMEAFVAEAIFRVITEYIPTSSYDFTSFLSLWWPVGIMTFLWFIQRSRPVSYVLPSWFVGWCLMTTTMGVLFRAYHHYWLSGLPFLVLFCFPTHKLTLYVRFIMVSVMVVMVYGMASYGLLVNN